MRAVFVDTFHWVAILNPRDQWHQQAITIEASLKSVRLVTTDEGLIETLNYLSSYGSEIRLTAIEAIDSILTDSTINVLRQTRDTLLLGLDLYQRRLDKQYSLTDCISMQIMRELGITEVLTHDHHFIQEGFTVLLGGTG